ncbi:MAG: energy transducer TonB [Acidobacteriota bacterium]|nr:energy transducer TonB [Acidobacteriota bacterium]
MRKESALTSLVIHVAALLLILAIAAGTAPVAKLPADLISLTRVKLPPYRAAMGGGAQSKTQVSFGHPPRSARTFMPPSPSVVNMAPKLVLPSGMDVPPALSVASAQIGDPSGLGKLLSGGLGGPRGMGDGNGVKLGPGSGGDVYQAGRGGVSAPVPIRRVEPEYSEEARKARAMGSVLVLVDVDTDGRVRNVRIGRSFGMGLDEKAIEAVSQWLFRPGMRDGRPVVVKAQIKVAFHLL